MNIRKHWNKICLSATAFFWTSCSIEATTNQAVQPSSDNEYSDTTNLSSENGGGIVALYGVNPVYDPDSGKVSSSDSCGDELCQASSSSVAQPSDASAQSSSSVKEVKYGLKVYSDTTVACKKGTYKETQTTFNGILSSTEVSVNGYICNNGENYTLNDFKQKGEYLYTKDEYEDLFGPCVDHGGRLISEFANPNYVNRMYSVTESELNELYHESFKENNLQSQNFSKEKKECFDEFYSDVEPKVLYGAFWPTSSSSSSTVTTSVEKITCHDGTVVNEEAYNAAKAKQDSLIAYYEQLHRDALYCDNFTYKERLDECNSIDDSGNQIPAPEVDTTKVRREILDDESNCIDF